MHLPSIAPTAALLFASAIATACVEPAAPDLDACGASELQHLVGQGEGALAAMTFPASLIRVIRPGDFVIEDYRPDRLNIELDDAGRIVRVTCG